MFYFYGSAVYFPFYVGRWLSTTSYYYSPNCPVKSGSSITDSWAIFPFQKVKPLGWLVEPEVWQTSFPSYLVGSRGSHFKLILIFRCIRQAACLLTQSDTVERGNGVKRSGIADCAEVMWLVRVGGRFFHFLAPFPRSTPLLRFPILYEFLNLFVMLTAHWRGVK